MEVVGITMQAERKDPDKKLQEDAKAELGADTEEESTDVDEVAHKVPLHSASDVEDQAGDSDAQADEVTQKAMLHSAPDPKDTGGDPPAEVDKAAQMAALHAASNQESQVAGDPEVLNAKEDKVETEAAADTALEQVERSNAALDKAVNDDAPDVTVDQAGNAPVLDQPDEAATAEEAAPSVLRPMRVVMTGPPVRLRMVSADKLCPRSMLVEWEDGSEDRQHWVSSADPLQSGWYEAEKLLPPSATNISVQFKIRALHKKLDVCMVDRQNGCSWIQLGQKRYTREIICFRVGSQCACDPIDAVFELKGPMHRCFLHRAWNAAREGAPEEWECWEDEDSRPPAEGNPATLAAADMAAAPQAYDSMSEYLDAVTSRFCGAALELLNVHRETLRGLRGLDAVCSGQWLRANVGTTASAGLMVAAVPLFFVMPPVGVGLAVAGSVAGSAAIGGDSLQERWSLSQLRRQLSRDGWNAFVAAELLKEWLRATSLAAAASGSSSSHPLEAETAGPNPEEKKNESRAMSAFKTGAYAIAFLGDEAAAALPALGPAGVAVGAVLTTGIAIHGWTTSKFSQKEVRGKMAELKDRLVLWQSLLARLGRLHCPESGRSISETDCVVRCTDNAHYCHASCLQLGPPVSSEGGVKVRCPVCGASMDETIRTLVEDVSSSRSSSAAAQGHETASEPPSGACDEAKLWQIAGQLDALESLFAAPPESAAQMSSAADKLEECRAGCKDLEEFVASADEHPDEMDLFLGMCDTLERLQRASERFEDWKEQASAAVAAEFEASVARNAQALPQDTAALKFQPAERLATESSSASSIGSASESNRSWSAKTALGTMGRRMTGSMGVAAQKASAMGQSASQKAAAAASELKGKARGVKDRAAGMAASAATSAAAAGMAAMAMADGNLQYDPDDPDYYYDPTLPYGGPFV